VASSQPQPQKPSLHEIAAMPYPASEQAVREYYDPHWQRYSNGETRKFSVEVDYRYSGRDTWTCEVDAADEAEAKKMALDKFDSADLDPQYGAEVDDVMNVKVERAELSA
jgi:hypothetical protein